MSGKVLYKCVSCDSYCDVDAAVHVDESMYVECDCGEKCEPVDSPADVIIELQNFILQTAEPALILAVHDYPVQHGPRGNLKELEDLREKLKF